MLFGKTRADGGMTVIENFLAGFGGWARTTTSTQRGAAYATAAWEGENCLKADILFSEATPPWTYTMRFEEDRLKMEISVQSNRFEFVGVRR